MKITIRPRFAVVLLVTTCLAAGLSQQDRPAAHDPKPSQSLALPQSAFPQLIDITPLQQEFTSIIELLRIKNTSWSQ